MSEEFFTHLSLFEGLSPVQLELLRPLFIPVDHYVDTALFEQGDPAEYLYVVVSGEVVVNFKPDDGPPLTVARVQTGGVVGWSAALGSRRYTSSAICRTYVQLLRVRGDDLRRLCTTHPETGILILDRLADVIAERLNSSHALVVNLLRLSLHNSMDKMGD